MNEERYAAIYISLVLLVGIIGLSLTGGIPGVKPYIETGINLGEIYVDDYRADIYLNGTLAEQFVYRIVPSGKYRMLYRSWKMPLSTQNLSQPYVEPLKVSPEAGLIPYIKQHNGSVQILSSKYGHRKSEVQSLAELNEAGGYYPSMFASGWYDMNYLFRIHPFLECDQELCHWNLKLADEHLPYKRVTICIHDPDNLTVQFFTRPEMNFNKVGDSWIITGSSPRNGLLEVEMLLKPEASSQISGFPRQVSDVKAKTLSAQSSIFDKLFFFVQSLMLIFPLLIALIYYKFGKEKHFIVPKSLSTIPAKRKPWLVNMVFKGDAFDFDEDGFYATLLDLDRRETVKIESTNGTRIMLLDAHAKDIDGYERKVLNFLKENSWNGSFFSAQGFEEKVELLAKSNDEIKLGRLHKTMDELMHYINVKEIDNFVRGRGLRTLGLRIDAKNIIIPLAFIFMVVLSLNPSKLLMNSWAVVFIALVLQSLIVAFAPSALFGKWKDDFYKEKLEWDAFRSFLSDFAMIQQYSPADLIMWKEWLVYGTALGVGDKVAQAMADMNIVVPEALAMESMHTNFSHAYSHSSPKSSGSGGSGGGFGGSGGGGGGGGGAR